VPLQRQAPRVVAACVAGGGVRGCTATGLAGAGGWRPAAGEAGAAAPISPGERRMQGQAARRLPPAARARGAAPSGPMMAMAGGALEG
jgi:hypothetical protein